MGIRFTRRRMLGAGAAVGVSALGGCGLFDDDSDPTPGPDPLQPVLDEALALAGAYERTAATDPDLAARLTPLAADHRAHATELSRVIGAALPSASASAAVAAMDLPELRKAVRAAQRTAAAAARVTDSDRAGLVGSIAACRASHAEALK